MNNEPIDMFWRITELIEPPDCILTVMADAVERYGVRDEDGELLGLRIDVAGRRAVIPIRWEAE